ncbi:MAG: zf-HC2 domain-containing protein [Rhodothermales bacterium]
MKRLLMKLKGMPSCEKVNTFIAMYLDNELPERDRKAFEKHLAMCGNCHAYFEQYKATIQAVKDADSVEIPSDLVEHTLEFLRSKAQSS